MPTLIINHEAPFSFGKHFHSRNLTQKQQCQNTTQHFGEHDSPIFGGLAQLRGGSGGRPLCKATTAEPLHTV